MVVKTNLTHNEKIKKYNEDQKVKKDAKTLSALDDSSASSDDKIKAANLQAKLDEDDKKNNAQEYQDKEDADKLDALKQLQEATSSIIDNVSAKVNPAKEWLAAQPTPGGLLALVAFIVFFMFAVVPVNPQGQTRLYLLWQSLLGRTHMLYSESGGYMGNPLAGGGAGGTFGPVDTQTASTNTNGQSTPLDISALNLFNFE